MNNDSARKIKHYLESFYDIPFVVSQSQHYGDSWFEIKPSNNARELFDITVKFKNNIRLTIEVQPEKFAAFSIQDMGSASLEKKKMFAQFAAQLKERRARTEFYINNTLQDVLNPELWPEKWNNYRLRVTRSPICGEDEVFDEAEVVSSWASIITGMFLSLLNVIQIESEEHLEGGLNRIETNRYERNPVNRELCLSANGYKCKICGFDFESCYGKIGHHFIHVHHIIPVSKWTEAYKIDPVKDMIPVCPNCHAMLHKSDPPYTPDELREMILTSKESN